jgi:taurine dioxygenase
MSGLEIRKIGGAIGAEIDAIDIRYMSEDDAEDVWAALLEHKVIVFRKQSITDADHLAFASRFGQLTLAAPTIPSLAGQPNILRVASSDSFRGDTWHTDCSFLRTPPKASTLRSLVAPPYGGDTLIANAGAAYRSLPEQLREFADRLWVEHTNNIEARLMRTVSAKDAEAYREVFTATSWRTAHPMVRVHPESGEPGLFIGHFADRIVGLTPSESRTILDIFQSYVTRPENVFRWRWAVGDLLMLDNRITQHYAPDDYAPHHRRLHRVTLAGDVPAGLDGRESYLLEGDDASHYTPVVH